MSNELYDHIKEVARVKPGETLVIAFGKDTPRKYMDPMMAEVRERFPDLRVLFVAGVEAMAVVENEAESDL